jgi:hypothetical protein
MAKFLFLLGLVSLFGYGYIQNIIHLAELSPFIVDAKSVIGIGGVFVPPVGVIMGLFIW